MIYSLIISPRFLQVSCGLATIATLGLFFAQLQFLAENHHMEFVPGEIGLEEKITILAAAYGFFLEHLGWAAKRLYDDVIPDAVQDLCAMAERLGIWMILIAVTMEVVDLAFLSLNHWFDVSPELKYAEVCVMFAMNGVFLSFLVRFFVNVSRYAAGRSAA